MCTTQCFQVASDDTVEGQSADDAGAEQNEAVRRVDPLRISTDGAASIRDHCDVAVEKILSITVEEAGDYTIMCTPCDVKALTVGFAFGEGLISSIDDVIEFSYQPDRQTAGLRLAQPAHGESARNLIITSSSGMCGSRNIARYLAGRITSEDSLRISGPLLRTVAEQMHARQRLFARTGGTHAAGIFTANGEFIAFAEDIGRHNSMDKAIGKCLMQKLSTAGCGVVLSGRVSLDLVAKAARAGLEIMAAVSAPSSLAIRTAQRCNITLCGFVRGRRATVYTCPHRIEGVLE